VRSPNLNSYAERFVRTIKESLPGTDNSVRRGRAAQSRERIHYAFYHGERNHQGIGKRFFSLIPISPDATDQSDV
jgi:hypothetical protein